MGKLSPAVRQRIESSGYRPGDVLRQPGARCRLILVGYLSDSEGKSFYGIMVGRGRNYPSGISMVGEFSAAGLLRDGYELIDINCDVIDGGYRPDSDRARHLLLRTKDGTGVIYAAGCRRFATYDAASRHWNGPSSNRPGREWKLATAKWLFAEAKKRGWIKPPSARKTKKKVRR